MTVRAFGHTYPEGIPQEQGQRPQHPARQTGAAAWM